MRKHRVECRIEKERAENIKELESILNFYYAQNIANILKRSDFSKEEKIRVIEQIQKKLLK